jgi:hypothetical protein
MLCFLYDHPRRSLPLCKWLESLSLDTFSTKAEWKTRPRTFSISNVLDIVRLFLMRTEACDATRCCYFTSLLLSRRRRRQILIKLLQVCHIISTAEEHRAPLVNLLGHDIENPLFPGSGDASRLE